MCVQIYRAEYTLKKKEKSMLLYDDSNKTNKRPPSEGLRLRRKDVHFQSALRAGGMAQRVNAPGDLSSVLRAHMEEGCNRFLHVTFSPPHLHCGMHRCTDTPSR